MSLHVSSYVDSATVLAEYPLYFVSGVLDVPDVNHQPDDELGRHRYRMVVALRCILLCNPFRSFLISFRA